ncbi:MAG: GNAT family N-acetyltransferase [Acidimicrobiia bacterium]|nr:GNAT family N-acetyltransferase [Acidimicrobiia bacterium]
MEPAPAARFEADVALADGGTVHVRPIVPDDAALIVDFHARQSPESIYFRYFSPRPTLTERDLERFTNVDYTDRMAFVGIIAGELVGIARYDRPPGRRDAEVAFFTDDGHAGRGIATVLLEYLAAAARDAGVTGFTATVLPQNRRMLSVFKQAGFAVTSHFADGVIEVELAIEPTEEALAAMDARAAASEARSVARILVPRSVAVVGASRRVGTLGHAVFRRLIEAGFDGPVYPVNSEADHVGSVRAYPSVLDVPDDIDLAVLVVPADQVLDVVEDCARKQVRGLVVISAGFAESGPEGAEEERRLVERVRSLGLRMVGPNTMGVVNTAPGVRLHASFTEVMPAPGRIGVLSQSGTIGAAVLDELGRHGLGVSTFVAAGNRADVSGNDLLQYWEQDERTDVVLLYLESFGNPRNFARIARRVAIHTPIVAVKPNRLTPLTDDGTVDGGTDGPEVAIDALLGQTGVIRVETLEQLVDAARVLANQPLPRGRRVALVSNFWGPAVLAADACIAAGLELPPLSAETSERLRETLRPGARVTNPVELTSEAGPREYGATMAALIEDAGVDAVLALYAPTIPDRTGEIARAVAGAASTQATTTVLASFLGPHPPGALDGLGPVPAFAFPEAAAIALGRICRYAMWRNRPAGAVPDVDQAESVAARAVAAAALDGRDGSIVLDPVAARELLATHGIDAVRQRLVDGEEDAVAAAAEIGYPVALKAPGLTRPAKTEAGGVAVDVHGDDELRRAFVRMADLHGAAMQPALLQAMGRSGTDVELVVRQHPTFGSVLSLGPAGTGALEPRVVPLTDLDAERLVDGVAGLDPEAAACLAELVLRLSALAVAVPELVELRLDPVLVSSTGAVPTDLHVRLEHWTRQSDPLVRRLA